MMAVNRFHDAGYRGIILKLPESFLSENDLDESIQAILRACEGSEYRDCKKNVTEIEKNELKTHA